MQDGGLYILDKDEINLRIKKLNLDNKFNLKLV